MAIDTLESEERQVYRDLSNEEAEQALLGALLVNNRAFDRVCGLLAADDFYDPAHQRIFDAIARKIGQGEQADPVTLAAEFRDDPELARDGGAAYLVELAGNIVTVVNAPDYARTIADLSRRRRLVLAGYDAIAAAADQTRPVIETVGATLADLERLAESRKARTGDAVLADLLDAWRGEPVIYSTGFPTIDAALGGGLIPGEVLGLLAHDKAGKTMLAASISHALNAAGIWHAYAALEMGGSQIERRHIARDLGIATTRLRGRIGSDVVAAVGRYRVERKSHVLYLDLPGATVEELRAEIVAAKAQRKVTGIVIDYWQLITGGSDRETQEAHLSRVANWISTLAKRLGLWVILLAQMNDEGTAPAYCKRGLNRAVDHLLILHREDGAETAWLSLKRSRHMPPVDIGGPNDPVLRMRFPGPYFEDIGTSSNGGAV
ncbi:AAA family ATPase [Azospirillum sp. YIM B02556]|uniref:DNA 5'-3' helicase n=1 Tax=Azospirillum endophyticum TaxID=2800326 RepID=A0ABS1FG87_9PROT|nr:DnaB-like helicase N-terminal domain-containing protein [Azospirillum endophyticum]MBK1842434.1 AAA family ATPase [Azospirillum endophyticum]